MKGALALIVLALILAGCAQQSPASGTQRVSANFQQCISQCGTGNAGNGTLCTDGCRMTEAAATKSTSMCDSLIDQANRPSCYGTVAKASSDISVCNRLTNSTDKNYCVAVFGNS